MKVTPDLALSSGGGIIPDYQFPQKTKNSSSILWLPQPLRCAMPTQFICKRITGKRQKAVLLALQLVCLPADKPITGDPRGCSFGLYDGKRMIAFAMARPSVNFLKTLYLSRAGVHPDYRGKGLQKHLIALRETWAKQHGFEHVITDTTNENIPSMRSLIASGYQPYWPELVRPWGLRKSTYWRKAL